MPFCCDHWTEIGAAHKIAAPTRTAPSVMMFFTSFSLAIVAEHACASFWVSHLIQIKQSNYSTSKAAHRGRDTLSASGPIATGMPCLP
jgi:hypothetical protein